MKKVLPWFLIGITAASESYGVGHIYISNYIAAPYNQVLWGFGLPGNQAVDDPNVQIQIWYGEGNVADDNLLIPGAITTISSFLSFYDPGAGFGPGGYFDGVIQVLPAWDPGDVYTFQLRAPDYPGRSALWTQQYEISPAPGYPINSSSVVPRLVLVPEPSSFALAFFAASGWLILRWRVGGGRQRTI
jgi:hypothetical protein